MKIFFIKDFDEISTYPIDITSETLIEGVTLQPIVHPSTHHAETPIQNYHVVGSVEPPRGGGVEGNFYDIPPHRGNTSVESEVRVGDGGDDPSRPNNNILT